MSTVPSYNFTRQQGEDATIALIYSEGDPAVPVDLTSYELRMDVSRSDGTRLYTFNSADIALGGVDEPGTADNEATLSADGEILIRIPRAATLPGGDLADDVGSTLNYDVFIRNNNNGTQKKILKGNITFEESVTLWT